MATIKFLSALNQQAQVDILISKSQALLILNHIAIIISYIAIYCNDTAAV